mgnify:FL=1
MAKPSNSNFDDFELLSFYRLSGAGERKKLVNFPQNPFFKVSER